MKRTSLARRRWPASTLVAFVAVMVVSITVSAAQESGGTDGHSIEVVATGFDNPRGIAIGSNGSIYVAESGAGGSELVMTTRGDAVCVGMTGAVTKIRGLNIEELATFPSLADAVDADGPGPAAPTCDDPGVGIATTGPAGVDVEADGDVIVSIGLGGDTAYRNDIPAELRDALGTLQQIKPDGTTNQEADLTAFEVLHNPDGADVDSNPFGVATLDFGHRLVVDSGGNDILEIDPWGGVRRYVSSFPRLAPQPFTPPSCFADLPPEAQQMFPPPGAPIPPESVPTAAVVGPDGAYYVGLLSGFPFAPGAAAVYRVDPETGSFHPFVSGLSHVMGLDFGPDGSLYIAELVSTSLLEAEICNEGLGSVIQVKDGVKTVVAELPFPGGLVVDYYGAIYVTTFSILPQQGEVVKITLAD